jgi:putative membrane-bound dehydrogenase-like protein
MSDRTNQPFSLCLAVLLGIAANVASPWGAGAEPFPEPVNTQPSNTTPLPPADLVKSLTMPPGFQATVFAAEPDVQQPIAMSFDARGRLWVIENYTYPDRATDGSLKSRDRIVVFEDTAHSGHFDRRTVFWDEGRHLTGLAVGLGGVWALDLPRLIFIPDANADLKPDGPPQIVLDGFDLAKAGHTMANGLKFGPDGWLYGREGIQADSLVGRPGAPDAERVHLGAAIWRVQPVSHRVELVAQGTTNPWGMDWDATGEAFFINTVIGHLWHVIPGAHYRRMYGDDPDPHVYRLIEQTADHVHWDTHELWQDVRKLGVTEASSKAGGGHAHTGLMIYQGDNWPAEYRGKLFTINFHGRRLNSDILEREGSGYVGRHGADHTFFGDPWFRGIDLDSGPDGGVFVLDWSDTGECHNHDGIHRTSGRIYKISYGSPAAPSVGDISKLSDTELVALQDHPNEWFVRASRLEMQRRALSGADVSALRTGLTKLHERHGDALAHLRALWDLQALGAVPEPVLRTSLERPDDHEQAWAIRLLTDSPTGAAPNADVLRLLRQTAEGRNAALVRLTLASVAQKLPPRERAPILQPLLGHAEDANDHNLPLMLWYAAAPLGDTAPDLLVPLAAHCEIPLTRRYLARRLGEEIERQPQFIGQLLSIAAGRDAAFQRDVLSGLTEALSGWRKAPKPPGWEAAHRQFAASTDPGVRQAAEEVAAIFGDSNALDVFRKMALDETRDLPVRRGALRVLVDGQAPGLREICEKLFAVHELSSTAAAGLALNDDPAIAEFIIARFSPLYGDEKAAAVAALVSRRPWAARFLQAVADGQIPRNSVNASVARQVRSLGDTALTAQLEKLVGHIGAVSPDKTGLVKKWKKRLSADVLAQADRQAGHTVFSSICAACHRLNGEGATIGPDLTGGQRDNLDYLLENLADPSAVVAPEFRLSTITMKDQRVLAGIIKSRNEKSLVLQTPVEALTLATDDVQSVQTSERSLMPDGLLDALSETQVRDLIAFLMRK